MTSSEFVRWAVAYAKALDGRIHSCWWAESHLVGCGRGEWVVRRERWVIEVESVSAGVTEALRSKMARTVGVELQVVDGRDRLVADVLVRVPGPVRS